MWYIQTNDTSDLHDQSKGEKTLAFKVYHYYCTCITYLPPIRTGCIKKFNNITRSIIKKTQIITR